MELTNYSRVAVVGGGPAGTLTANFLLENARHLGLHLNVDIYEPAHFGSPGPKGCNHCGGIVSETLVQMLAMEGINLPPDVIQRGIDSYELHTENGSASIKTPLVEMRIAALYRGSGPRDCQSGLCGDGTVQYHSFDGYLMDLALEKGARLKPYRVTQVVTRHNCLPKVCAKGTEDQTYDLVVGAVGVNSGGLKAFEKAGFDYRPPQTTKAFVTEIHLGQEGTTHHFGNAMHVFLLKIPKVSFAAIVPKGEYVTVIMLGKDLNKDIATGFLAHPVVKARFPKDANLTPKSCMCLPQVNIGMPPRICTDRVVMVGDTGVSRLYKDGIGAAYRTAKACATTAVVHGVSAKMFRKYYLPTCRRLNVDNSIGKMVFLTVDLFKAIPALSRGMLGMVRKEQGTQRLDMSMVLWDTFTGSNTYRSILLRCLHPGFLIRLLVQSAISLFPGLAGSSVTAKED
ncbi:MAG: hypothetical protein GY731_13890, partial [Gammaproteobacteria bacterium]|nr:hypothetical protein [Gammaproteobacteria bacterium]